LWQGKPVHALPDHALNHWFGIHPVSVNETTGGCLKTAAPLRVATIPSYWADRQPAIVAPATNLAKSAISWELWNPFLAKI
jgi:hypothetical protein